MQHIWIIEKNSGTTLFYRNYADIKIDPDLVSGLLSALNNFSEVEMRQNGIESINMGGLKWCYVHDPTLDILLISADSKIVNTDIMRSSLKVIKNIFIQAYNITENSFRSGLVNIHQFDDFDQTLETLRVQWEQAEKAMGTAASFDLIGVFQQIFNSANSIIHGNVFGDKLQNLLDEIDQFVEEFPSIPRSPRKSRLFNLTFDKQQGWNILTLNPMNLDGVTLKKVFFNITENLKDMITKYLGNIIALNEFNKEIFPYILSNWDLLQQLSITRNLLDVMLRRTPAPKEMKNDTPDE